jgi:hypothetical protein
MDSYMPRSALLLLPGQTNYIPHIFILGSSIIMATKIHMTFNHSEIVFKFSLIPPY